MAEQETSDVITQDTAETVPMSQYKALQTQLNKAKQGYKDALRSQVQAEAQERMLVQVLEAVQKSVELQEAAGALGGAEDKVTAFKEAIKRQGEELQAARAAGNEAADILGEAGTDWSDPRLAEAYAKWQSGDVAGALAAAKQSLKGGTDLDALVAAKVAELVKAGAVVDTGQSQPTGEGVVTLEQIKRGGASADQVRKFLAGVQVRGR